MGILTGYICLICFILLAVKFIIRKTKNQKLNQFFMKIHKPVSGIFLLTAVIHFVLVWKVLDTRDKMVTISGIVCLGMAILMVVLCHTMKNGKKKMFWHRVLTVVILLVVVLHIVTYVCDFIRYQECIGNVELEDADISVIPNGDYEGEFDAGYIYAKVLVTVENGRVTQIELLEHRNERGQRAESIIDDIVSKQSLEVDAISGATNSSLVIKKACENALRNGQSEYLP